MEKLKVHRNLRNAVAAVIANKRAVRAPLGPRLRSKRIDLPLTPISAGITARPDNASAAGAEAPGADIHSVLERIDNLGPCRSRQDNSQNNHFPHNGSILSDRQPI